MERRKRFGSAFRQYHKHPAGLRSGNKPAESFDPGRYSGDRGARREQFQRQANLWKINHRAGIRELFPYYLKPFVMEQSNLSSLNFASFVS